METLGINKKMQLLGKEVEFVLYKAEGSLNETVFDKIYTEMLRLQKIFNFFDPESELSLLNKKRTSPVSQELLEVITMCLPWCEFTGGTYDISKGKEIMQRKKDEEITPVKCSYKDIKISGNTISLTQPEALIDLGSVAKGYIGDKMKEFLKKNVITSAFIDLRGDMIFWGEFTEKINIQHPRDPEKSIFSFKKSNAAVATSGDYEQYYGSYEKSHIINAKDFCSVTVVADTLAEADILATCIFTEKIENLEKYADKKYFVVHNNLSTFRSKNFP
jgi:thiamine biosynthesis lipoprotein